MNRKYIFLTILILSLLLFCLCCRKPYDIKFETELYDFGEVIEGEDVDYTFVFKNIGTQDIMISRVQPACVCTIAYDWDKKVASGNKGRIPVIFKTPQFNGEVVKVIFVKTNIPEYQSIQLSLKGKVIIPVEVIPRNTWLGDIDENTGLLSGSFKIINNTETLLKIYEVIPPEIEITFMLTTLEENRKYTLDYIIYPPFKGSGTVSNLFTLKTNLKDNENIELKFFYYRNPTLYNHQF